MTMIEKIMLFCSALFICIGTFILRGFGTLEKATDNLVLFGFCLYSVLFGLFIYYRAMKRIMIRERQDKIFLDIVKSSERKQKKFFVGEIKRVRRKK